MLVTGGLYDAALALIIKEKGKVLVSNLILAGWLAADMDVRER